MSLEKKKKQVELARVKAARLELEYKIEERLNEIERLKEHIKLQEAREAELEKELGG